MNLIKIMYFKGMVFLITAVFFFSSCEEPPPPINENYIVLENYELMVMRKDMGKNTWSGACSICEQLRFGGFFDWRLPTQAELLIMYNERNNIGGFDTFNNIRYWSSTPYIGGFYVCLNFTTGQIENYIDNPNHQPLAFRCVRDSSPSLTSVIK